MPIVPNPDDKAIDAYPPAGPSLAEELNDLADFLGQTGEPNNAELLRRASRALALPPRIVLFMEGGIIHEAFARDPETVIEIVDHDLLENGSSARPWSDEDRAGLVSVPTAIINEVDQEDE